MTRNTDTAKLDRSNLGQAAIFTDNKGASRSVTITTVLPNDIRIAWHTGPRATESLWVHRSAWGHLVLFPEGCDFLAV